MRRRSEACGCARFRLRDAARREVLSPVVVSLLAEEDVGAQAGEVVGVVGREFAPRRRDHGMCFSGSQLRKAEGSYLPPYTGENSEGDPCRRIP